jgi:hypothetical protein
MIRPVVSNIKDHYIKMNMMVWREYLILDDYENC